MVKLATLNLCLVLKNKKDFVVNTIRNEKIEICGLQVIEIEKDFPIINMLARSFNFECESNDIKSRVGLYVKSDIAYERKFDLEGRNNSVIIIDFGTLKKSV